MTRTPKPPQKNPNNTHSIVHIVSLSSYSTLLLDKFVTFNIHTYAGGREEKEKCLLAHTRVEEKERKVSFRRKGSLGSACRRKEKEVQKGNTLHQADKKVKICTKHAHTQKKSYT